MTSRWRYLAAVAVAFVLLGAHVRAQEASQPKPTLTAEQTLRAEIFKLRVEVAQLRATVADRDNKLAGYALTEEQAKLAAEFVAALGGKAGDTWDWQTMTLKKADKPKEK